MIQRIQSLYLLIAGIFPAITLFAPVLIYGDPASDRWMTMTSLGYDATLVQEMAGRTPYGLLFFTVVLSVIPLFAIFDFKNRRRQIQRTNIALFSGLLWYVALTAYALSVPPVRDST